jgi:FkbM family methyltransferase
MRRSLVHHVNSRLSRTGYVVARSSTHRLARVLSSLEVELVLDVGANRGQFASGLRAAGYSGQIRSFEPVSDAFQELARRAAKDPYWDAFRSAVGSDIGTKQINVASNHAASSSFLPLMQAHAEAAPDIQYVRVEQVPISTLDALTVDLEPARRVCIKIDTQGYEREVLAGSTGTIQQAQAVLMEVSFVELYEGSLLLPEALSMMEQQGFVVGGVERGFCHPSGQVLQADMIFVRSGLRPSGSSSSDAPSGLVS